MVAWAVEPDRLLFVEECGTYTSLGPIYAYAPRGERLSLPVPRGRGKDTRVLSSMTLSGMGASLAVEGATTARVFETYVSRRCWCQACAQRPDRGDGQPWRPQAKTHHRELIEQQGCELLYLCRPTRLISTP